MIIPIKSYSERRKNFALRMHNGIAIIPTSPEQVRSRDGHYPYRCDSYFYYLTGFTEPEALLVIVAETDKKKTKHILFCRNKDVDREIWNGFCYGPEAACEAFNFDEAYPISELDRVMPTLLTDQPVIYFTLGESSAWDLRVTGWIKQAKEQVRSSISIAANFLDSHLLLNEMRLFKSKEELEVMRKAAEISSGAHCRAMRKTKPGIKEYELEAELLHEFRSHGSQGVAYTPIVAGGANACVLHYIENNAELKSDDLVLIDAGCELNGYAADITRTFPVNGRFSAIQKELYQLVLSAQIAAIDKIRPSNPWDAAHESALKVLVQGFIDLGLCRGSVDGVIQSKDYKRFYMHRTSHWLGLDVHDAGEYGHNGESRLLYPGMVLTVEPGCYIRPADNIPSHFWNIGIRIEDDVVVTETGCEVLTVSAPKTVLEIEALMR